MSETSFADCAWREGEAKRVKASIAFTVVRSAGRRREAINVYDSLLGCSTSVFDEV
jgi:hypothetical protein